MELQEIFFSEIVVVQQLHAWHQVTILEEEREEGGGAGPHGPSPGSATVSIMQAGR